MKQYIFTFDTNRNNRDLLINANGIYDAVDQVKEIKKQVEFENKHDIKIKFKGVRYKNIS
ncbi:hypothetical protein [Bacillus sp. OTU530]|uniref:hypothetical protein n=1 Tax=Bacillus sp. OTU530 TaxID=3043862 RepID=UPI00313F0800